MKWLGVVGYEGKYEVSNTGRIRKVGGVYIGMYKNHDGYLIVRLSSPRKEVRVHRVVAEAFIGNSSNLPVVNHIDCVRDNNNASNLEWCTQRHNLNHSQMLGRMQRNYWTGKRSPSATLDDETVQHIRAEYSSGGVSWKSLALKYNTNKRTVGRIVAGESYV